MDASDEMTATDDYMEWLRLVKSSQLVKDTFTSDELVTLAHQSGHTFVKGQTIRDWTRRDVFPPAPIEGSRSGGRFTGGQWPRVDAVRLLDTCWLHEQNCRGRALQLGLWLLSYTPLDGADPRDLLAEQIERMEEVLFDQTRPADPAALSDEDQNRIAERIEETKSKPGHRLLDDLCAGLDARAVGMTDVYFEEDMAQYLPASAPVSLAELARFTALSHAGDDRLPPLPATPEAAVAPYFEERMRQLNQLLSLKQPPSPDAAARIIAETSPHGDFPASNLTGGALTAAQRDLIAAHLWGFAGLLPQLRHVLADATDEELGQARNFAAPLVLRALKEQQICPSPDLTGLARFMGHAGSDLRRLFAAPPFFPLTAYLIGALVYSARHPGQIAFRWELAPVALDQLARLMRESTSRAEAFLSVLFSAVSVAQASPEHPGEESE